MPDWAQLILAVLTLGGLVLGTYVSNEVARASIATEVARHTQEIAELKSQTQDIPVVIEQLRVLSVQNERQIVTFEKFADNVDRLTVTMARIEERMRAIEEGRK